MSDDVEKSKKEIIPKKETKKRKGAKRLSSLWCRNYARSRSGTEDELKRAIKDFLLRWLHENTSLYNTHEIGSKLYDEIINTYPEHDEEDEEGEWDDE